ncbi:MAG TPA: PilZ domain-containing protein [Phycisphaerae bacterium]|nr:PilZ domain-containing protein [Phycisphaerae bacterium]
MAEVLLSEEERHQLVAVLRELDPAAPREKRAGPRRKVLLSIWIRHLAKGKSRSLQKGLLVDVSRKGLALLLDGPMSIGDKVVAPLEFGEGGGWLALCEVRNCRREARATRWKVGVQFIDRIEDVDGKARIPGDWLAYAR